MFFVKIHPSISFKATKYWWFQMMLCYFFIYSFCYYLLSDVSSSSFLSYCTNINAMSSSWRRRSLSGAVITKTIDKKVTKHHLKSSIFCSFERNTRMYFDKKTFVYLQKIFLNSWWELWKNELVLPWECFYITDTTLMTQSLDDTLIPRPNTCISFLSIFPR
jgi:hypothetical protein